jgi:hypothetical protein
VIGALLLAVAAPTAAAPAPQTAIDAERAFVADAQAKGQWTAFRAWSTPDALMFTPQPVKAHEFLNGRSDPPTAVFWWPGASFVSCDGDTAVNTGPWVREWGKSVGYFTTVWQRQGDRSWKWVYDAGDELKRLRAQGGDIEQQKATCPRSSVPTPPRGAAPANARRGGGASRDLSLSWDYWVAPDGSRAFFARAWDGQQHRIVIADRVAAPPR